MAPARAIRQEHRQRHEAREPEEHGDCLGGEDGEFVVRARFGEAPGDEDEVEQGEERPDGGEDEEADLLGGACVPVMSPPIGT